MMVIRINLDLILSLTKGKKNKSQGTTNEVSKFDISTKPNIPIANKLSSKGKEKPVVENLISSIKNKDTKNKEAESSSNDKVIQLTNCQAITNFYSYTRECLLNYCRISHPTTEQLVKLAIESFPFDEELKSNFSYVDKKLAVFDLDETLVHCVTKNIQTADVQLVVNNVVGNVKEVYREIGINIRPFAMESLKEIKKNYVVIVYTASHQSYADEVLNHLDPQGKIFAYRLYRHNCVQVKMAEQMIYVKDLRIFKNIDLKKIIIIDNSALSFAFHLENGIPILPFYKDKNDVEMKSLVNYLNQIATFEDLREVNKKFLKLDYFLNKHIKVDEDDSIYYEESEILNDEETQGKDLFQLNPCEKSKESINENSFEEGKSRNHLSKHHKGSLNERLEEFSSALKDFKK